MPLPDLTEADRAILAELVRERIAADRFPLSPRVRRLKAILAKLEPSAEKPAVTPYQAPRPAGEPSLLYRKLRGGGRRRYLGEEGSGSMDLSLARICYEEMMQDRR